MKPWTQSKTMWFSIALSIFGAVDVLLPQVRDQIPPDYYGWIVMAIGVTVAGLRVVTTQGVTR